MLQYDMSGKAERKSFFFLKRAEPHNLGYKVASEKNHKTPGTVPFGQMRPKSKCLAIIIHCTMLGEN